MVLSTNCWRADNGPRMGPRHIAAPLPGDCQFNHEKPCPARKELLSTSIQRALQHLLKPIHLERLLQRRPVAIGLSRLAIARRKEERRAAGTRASATGETGWPLRL